MSHSAEEKKAYWQKRMTEKISSQIKQNDPLWDEIIENCNHAGVQIDRVKKALEVIGVGFAELLNAVNEVAPRTKEGVVDLGKVSS